MGAGAQAEVHDLGAYLFPLEKMLQWGDLLPVTREDLGSVVILPLEIVGVGIGIEDVPVGIDGVKLFDKLGH
jgi:hypothetical protein